MPVRVPKTEAHRLPNKTAHLTVDGWEEDYMVGIGALRFAQILFSLLHIPSMN